MHGQVRTWQQLFHVRFAGERIQYVLLPGTRLQVSAQTTAAASSVQRSVYAHGVACLKVLLHPASLRLQDDASEDPLTAARAGATGAAELYWKQKMVPSIKEVFATCLSSNALQVPDQRCREPIVVFESGLQHRLSVLNTV
jgi:hypothetical protein